MEEGGELQKPVLALLSAGNITALMHAARDLAAAFGTCLTEVCCNSALACAICHRVTCISSQCRCWSGLYSGACSLSSARNINPSQPMCEKSQNHDLWGPGGSARKEGLERDSAKRGQAGDGVLPARELPCGPPLPQAQQVGGLQACSYILKAGSSLDVSESPGVRVKC